jgi:hypothetical protein
MKSETLKSLFAHRAGDGRFMASDWTGHYRDVLPDGQPWSFVDYFTEERILVNPAIVHAMRSKTALIAAAGVGG